MSDSNKLSAEEISQQRDAFIERFLGYASGTFSLFSIYIGDRLGYYRALAEGSLTSAELAARTNTHERYAREWLEQQTVAGILKVEDENAEYMSVCNLTHPRALQILDAVMVGRALASRKAIQKYMWMASTSMNPLSSWLRKMRAGITSQTACTSKCAMWAIPRSRVNMIW
jgi:hypothetical protein